MSKFVCCILLLGLCRCTADKNIDPNALLNGYVCATAIQAVVSKPGLSDSEKGLLASGVAVKNPACVGFTQESINTFAGIKGQ